MMVSERLANVLFRLCELAGPDVDLTAIRLDGARSFIVDVTGTEAAVRRLLSRIGRDPTLQRPRLKAAEKGNGQRWWVFSVSAPVTFDPAVWDQPTPAGA